MKTPEILEHWKEPDTFEIPFEGDFKQSKPVIRRWIKTNMAFCGYVKVRLPGDKWNPGFDFYRIENGQIYNSWASDAEPLFFLRQAISTYEYDLIDHRVNWPFGKITKGRHVKTIWNQIQEFYKACLDRYGEGVDAPEELAG